MAERDPKRQTRRRGESPNAGGGERPAARGRGSLDDEGEVSIDSRDDEAPDDAGDEDEDALVAEVVSDDDEGGDGAAIDEELGEIVDASLGPARERPERESLVTRDPLTAYIQETRRYRLLSREEEHELAVKWAEHGDADAARQLIEANLRLVVKIAYEYRRAHRNLLDMIQEGNIGLMQAVKKYDPYRGVKLSSYAAWWIRAYILKFILNNWRMVKLGTTQAQRKLFFNLRKEKEKLEQLGFTPDTKLLAERLDVSEKEIVDMERRLAAPDASLDAPVGGDDGEGGVRTRMDFLAGQHGDRPDVEVEQSEFSNLLKQKLEAFADELEGREETIFRERWLTDTPLTLQEIGDRYGVSRERARQLEKRLLGRLRTYLEDELGTAVDIGSLGGD
jgi:RNA polymerase sigma-32 factor